MIESGSPMKRTIPMLWEFLCIDCVKEAVHSVPAAADCRGHAWCPSGGKYLVETIHGTKEHGFIILEAPEKLLACGPPMVHNARWSPSGRLIAHVTPSRPEYEQRVLGIFDPAQNRNYQVHVEQERSIQDPIWIPNESELLAVIEGPRRIANKSGPMEICLFNLKKKGFDRLISNDEPDSFIGDHIVSKNGRYLAYRITRASNVPPCDREEQVLSKEEIDDLMTSVIGDDVTDGKFHFVSELKIYDLQRRAHLFEDVLKEYDVDIFTWITGRNRIAFKHKAKGKIASDLALVDLDSGQLDHVDEDINGPHGESGTPNGRISFLSMAHSTNPIICYVKWGKGHANELYTYNVDTKRKDHIYTGHFIHDPQWSMISDRILLMESPGPDARRLFPTVVDTNDKTRKKILQNHENFGWLSVPKWSPDERFIVAKKSTGILAGRDG